MAYEPRTVQADTPNALPTGTQPAVDPTAIGDVQAIKLIDGTPGSIEHITGTTADGLLVNLGGNNDVTAAELTDGTQKTQIVDANGNVMSAYDTGEGGPFGMLTWIGNTSLPSRLVSIEATDLALKSDTIFNALSQYGLGLFSVRKDAAASLASTDGYVSPLITDANGRLWTNTSGTVTANAGTNLNTSALALETGGNLAAAATSLALLDNAISGSEMQVDVVTLPTITEPKSTTATTSQVADNSSSVTILASNASRLGATILNDSSAALYLRLGSSAATTTNYTVRITQYGYYEVPFRYTGAITGIWASDPGDGAARVTELT
jgi:hypothetical protein